MALQEEFEKQGNFLFRYRSYFPLILLIIGIVFYTFSEINSIGEIETPLSDIYEILCLTICIFGLSIRIFSVGFSDDRTSGRNTKKQVADSLNTTGIYSVVRHPLYIGNYFMWLGVCMFTENIYFLVIFSLTFWIYYERIMFAEELFLRNKFGMTYLSWASKTPAFFPKIKNYKKPTNKFNLKKILRKEKDGFFAFILILFFLEIYGEFIEEKTFNLDDSWWYLLFVLGFISYLTLKILKKKKYLKDNEK
jgi:protein-S-isoprenylcysteine O-methyltransferase Ste14